MRSRIKLSEWAKRNGVSYKTAHRMFKKDQLPVPATQHPDTGTILVMVEGEGPESPTDLKALLSQIAKSQQDILWRLRRIETHLEIA